MSLLLTKFLFELKEKIRGKIRLCYKFLFVHYSVDVPCAT